MSIITKEQKPNIGGSFMDKTEFNDEIQNAIEKVISKHKQKIAQKERAPITQYRGRKMKPGRLAYMPGTAQMGIFIDYCPSCHTKVFILKTDLPEFMKFYRKDQKRLMVRLAKWAACKLSDVGE